jgi:hypothetical protein
MLVANVKEAIGGIEDFKNAYSHVKTYNTRNKFGVIHRISYVHAFLISYGTTN